MSARKPLPQHLTGRAFTVELATTGGVPKHRLQARDLVSPFWGVRAPADAPLSLLYRCRLLSLALPEHSFFSGATAAALLGMPVPLVHTGPLAILEIGVAAPARSIRVAGCMAAACRSSGRMSKVGWASASLPPLAPGATSHRCSRSPNSWRPATT